MAIVWERSLAPPFSKSARASRRDLAGVLAKAGFSRRDLGDVGLALTEAITNLERHPEPGPTRVDLSLERAAGAWNLKVADDGAPFGDASKRLAGMSLEPFGPELREGGMGIHLVARLCPGAKYLPGGAGEPNLLCLPLVPRKTVLLVEDDPAQRDVLDTYLVGAYRVDAVESAEAALEYLAGQIADLVISDISLPGMSGLELRAALNRAEGGGLVPFIFLTGSDDERLEAEAIRLGIDDYLTKPITKSRLLSVIGRLMHRLTDMRAGLSFKLEGEITRALAPHLPSPIGGFSAAVASFVPEAGGGDLLLAWGNKGRETIFFSDIMGHGFQAKFFAHAHLGHLSGLIRSLPNQGDPAGLLSSLSAILAADPMFERVILTCLVASPGADGSLTFASAGHPLPWLIGHKGVGSIGETGPLPGLGGDPVYRNHVAHVGRGQRLLLWSDGLIDDPKVQGQRRAAVEAACLKTLDQPLGQACQAILDAARKGGDDLADDATIALLEPASGALVERQ